MDLYARWMRSIGVVIGLLSVSTAWAEPTDVKADSKIMVLDQETLDQAEGLFFSGLSHYRRSHFEEAAVDFQKAFTLTHHRDLLYNIARSREQLGDIAGAIEWYRTYLTTQPADETAMIHKIRLLGGDPSGGGTHKVEIKAKPPVEEVVEERGAGAWPWVVLSVGAASVGAGTYLGLQALDEAKLARASDVRSEAEEHKDSAESQAMLADIGFAVGAVAVGGAVLLWWMADDEMAASGEVQVGVTPGGASVGYTVQF